MPEAPEPERILVSQRWALGDVVWTTPALAALRQRYPDAFIAVRMMSATMGLLAGNQDVDELIPYASPRYPARRWQTLRRICDMGFDTHVLCESCIHGPDTVLIPGTVRRVGFVGRHPWGQRSMTHLGWALTHRLPLDEVAHLHRTEALLRLVGLIGCDTAPRPTRLFLQPDEVARASRALNQQSPGDGPVVCVHLGASWVDRRWPPELFAQAADVLHETLGCRFVVLAGPPETDVVAAFGSAVRTAPWCQMVSGTVREMAAIIANADLFIGNDSGPLHIAAALRLPLVGLYGPDDPANCGPDPTFSLARVLWHRTDCCPCSQQRFRLAARCPRRADDGWCMASIKVADVVAAARGLLPSPGVPSGLRVAGMHS